MKRKPPKGLVLRKVPILLRGVPQRVRDNFKAYCARRNISMKDRLIELMIEDANKDIETLQNARKIERGP